MVGSVFLLIADFAVLYASELFQLTTGLMGVFSFCNFIVACRLGATEFMLPCARLYSICVTFL